MINERYGQGTHSTKMGADKSADNITNAPKFICPNCLPYPKSLGFLWKKVSLGVRSPWERIICKVENALGLEFHHPSILRNTTPGQLNYCVQRTSQKIARLGSKDHIKSKIKQVKQFNSWYHNTAVVKDGAGRLDQCVYLLILNFDTPQVAYF